MTDIVILGAGNVAKHLVNAFAYAEGLQVVQVYNRSKRGLSAFKENPTTTDIDALAEADLYILAVADDAIEVLSESLPLSGRLVVHTSGSVSIDHLSNKNRKGIFYPLQTFSKDKEVSFEGIPICLEAEDSGDLELLENVAEAISKKVYHINSAQRKSLHLAAVFVNNFVNHLYQIGSEICEANEVPFEVLAPLIEETANKVKELPPKKAQTGPAKRQDITTIKKQLDSLADPIHKEIYELLTDSIISTYGRKEL